MKGYLNKNLDTGKNMKTEKIMLTIYVATMALIVGSTIYFQNKVTKAYAKQCEDNLSEKEA